MWQPEGWEFCWRCEELNRKENIKKHENKFRDNGVQRVGGNQEVGTVPVGKQEDK
jgi:hypothetical protein